MVFSARTDARHRFGVDARVGLGCVMFCSRRPVAHDSFVNQNRRGQIGAGRCRRSLRLMANGSAERRFLRCRKKAARCVGQPLVSRMAQWRARPCPDALAPLANQAAVQRLLSHRADACGFSIRFRRSTNRLTYTMLGFRLRSRYRRISSGHRGRLAACRACYTVYYSRVARVILAQGPNYHVLPQLMGSPLLGRRDQRKGHADCQCAVPKSWGKCVGGGRNTLGTSIGARRSIRRHLCRVSSAGVCDPRQATWWCDGSLGPRRDSADPPTPRNGQRGAEHPLGSQVVRGQSECGGGG